jgi:purine-binding chemotaxis protein CheW
VRRIARAALQPPLPTLTGIGADYVQGVTADGVVVLDVERVLADPKLRVDEEPAPDNDETLNPRSFT